MFRFSLVLLIAGVAGARDVDLFARLGAADLAKCSLKNASVSQDPATKSLTFTFDPAGGEPEVRMPVRALGWPVDWRGWRSIQYTFQSSTVEPVSIAFDDGSKLKAALIEPLAGIRISAVIPFDLFVQTRSMNPLSPLGYKIWPQRLFTFEKVEALVFRMRYPNRRSQITVHNFTLRNDVPADNIVDKKPLIDRYGQWIPKEWPGKAHNDGELRALWDADRSKPVAYGFCPLGGDAAHTLRASGFFRVEKVNGQWLFVDPHGHPFFSTGMDLVGYKQGSFATSVNRREYLFESLPPDGPAWLKPDAVSFYVANIMKRFGEKWQSRWLDHTVERLKSWGFNTIANWSDYDVATRAGIPYVLPLQGWETKRTFSFPWNFPDIFSQEFERNADEAARRQVTPLKSDPNLIGWFIGNEPQWARSFGSLVPWPDMLLADPTPSATKSKLKELLRAAGASKRQQVKDEFLYTCARRYFEVITAAVRRHDPNHLVLGIRFAENPNDRWVEMSRSFDVFSVNIYSREFMPNPANIRRFSEVSGKPVLIGEFTACAPGRGMQGLFYWGHKVRDYAERGKAYRYYVENSAASPYIIGTHWFQMVDDLPTGRPGDGERLNYGFLNVLDLPYPDLVEAAQQAHRRVYALKSGKAKPYDEKPAAN